MRRAVSSQEQELQMGWLEVIGRKAGAALPEESQNGSRAKAAAPPQPATPPRSFRDDYSTRAHATRLL